ncbi:hypothetical protein ACWGRK_14825 [Saccharomonospora azurea]|uniref:Uncharacterized protein n=1 Tax=Saccharomonospora azurea NA-128 TaxID=882081 RepID=H8GCU1_9PSEU|nr:hypothetical protein [Saccharomonospora azurea]EHY87777.1 hypothetical protein SacazDRAFT_00830 [Saccharomonospora azurea NA-128]
MATRKVTVSLDDGVLAFAEQAAKAHGVSLSAWLSKAARREVVRTGFRVSDPAGSRQAAEQAALRDEAELVAALEDLRAQG